MKHTTLKNQIKEQKGVRFWAGDVIVIETPSTPMISSSINIVYKNSFFQAADERLSLPNNEGVWKFLKTISEDRTIKVSIKVQVWDKKGKMNLIDFKDSKPYMCRFIPSYKYDVAVGRFGN